ncbi:hypothetical protein NDU88_003790 [Pleurodeles waltl]|uniref:Uncharacterized protein n=1 Tax=Pleurodeles waltl TaxID=8319 RepID=A0AAV7PFL8_PLEWA|nr:hypothetical protein NDU88_003790 [Pleurodeles waltl]
MCCSGFDSDLDDHGRPSGSPPLRQLGGEGLTQLPEYGLPFRDCHSTRVVKERGPVVRESWHRQFRLGVSGAADRADTQEYQGPIDVPSRCLAAAVKLEKVPWGHVRPRPEPLNSG